MKKKKYWLAGAVLLTVLIIINLLGQSEGFCDWYVDNIFPLWTNTLARFNNLFPFSVGEVMIALLIFWLVFLLVCIVINFFKRIRLLGKWLRGTLHFVLVIGLVLSLNLSLLYNTANLYPEDKEFTSSQLMTLRNYILEKCNELCEQVERDEDGLIVYQDDMQQQIISAYQSLSEQFPRLAGYYPEAKEMMGSYFMYQAGVLGVYFPHTLEAMYNKYVSQGRLGYTVAHELAHLKGYIYEDEANFFAYLSCVNSEDPAIQYSGYLGVLDYVNNDLYEVYLISGSELTYGVWCGEVYGNELILQDDVSYDEATKEYLGQRSEVIADVSDAASDVYYDFYQVEQNYSEVTRLLLNYYEGILY